MATGFLNWGKHVDPKDVKAGDVVVLGTDEGGIFVKPKPGMYGHSAIATGPPVKRTQAGVDDWWEQPAVMGAWHHHVAKGDMIVSGEGEGEVIAEYRRPPPSHHAQKYMLTVHMHAKMK